MAFFGELYLRSTRPFLAPEVTTREAGFIARTLRLAPGQRALDIGCGHGRHLALLAGRGLDVWGLDFDALSLDQLPPGVRPRAIRGDLYALPFARPFDAAYAWYATLFISPEESRNLEALREAARVLRPGGRLLVHGHNPAAQACEPESHFEATLTDGAKLSEETWYEPGRNVLHGRRRLEHAGRVLEGEFLVRCPTADDHARWAQQAGLTVEAQFGDVQAAPYRATSPDLIVLLRK